MPKRDRVVPAGVLVGLDMAVGAGVPCYLGVHFRFVYYGLVQDLADEKRSRSYN